MAGPGRRGPVAGSHGRGGGSFLDVGGYAARFAVGCFAENVGVAAQSEGLDHDLSTSDDAVEFTFTGRREPVPHKQVIAGYHTADLLEEAIKG